MVENQVNQDQVFIERYNQFQAELASQKVSDEMVQALVKGGWTVPMVREAREVVATYGASFSHVVKLRNAGISISTINDLYAAREGHPDLTIVQLHKCWTTVNHGRATEENKSFFAEFLNVVEDLFGVASDRKGIARVRSFLFSRLMEYVDQLNGDIERIFVELHDDPEDVLE